MTKFDRFYTKFQNTDPKKLKLKINDRVKIPKGIVLLNTKKFPKSTYIKIIFIDKSFLLILVQDKELYYAGGLIGHIKSIKDSEIGNKKLLEFKDKKYKLENANDYQYVIKRILGGPKDVEGEVRFSDYFPISGPKEFLSLGWLSETGERADINCQIIDIKKVKIL